MPRMHLQMSHKQTRDLLHMHTVCGLFTLNLIDSKLNPVCQYTKEFISEVMN